MTEPTTATRTRRVLAAMIDYVIVPFLGVLGAMFAAGKHWDLAAPEELFPAMFGTMLVVFAVYLLKDSVRGVSPGRFVLGIAVREEAEPDRCPSTFRLALRNLFVVILPVEFLMLAFSQQKRRLGDRLARTVVVRREDTPGGKRFLAFLGLVLVVGGLFATGAGAIIRNSAAYEQAVDHIETDRDVRERVGDVIGYGRFPTGTIQLQNGHGRAQLRIKVNGTKGNILAVLAMSKAPDAKWELDSLQTTD